MQQWGEVNQATWQEATTTQVLVQYELFLSGSFEQSFYPVAFANFEIIIKIQQRNDN